jgi:hypothetical protein
MKLNMTFMLMLLPPLILLLPDIAFSNAPGMRSSASSSSGPALHDRAVRRTRLGSATTFDYYSSSQTLSRREEVVSEGCSGEQLTTFHRNTSIEFVKLFCAEAQKKEVTFRGHGQAFSWEYRSKSGEIFDLRTECKNCTTPTGSRYTYTYQADEILRECEVQFNEFINQC